MKISILLLLISVIFSSCSTLDKDRCTKTNWMHKGEHDGITGLESHFSKYEKQCLELGVTISEFQYNQGYEKGLQQFKIDAEKKLAIKQIIEKNKSERCMVDSDCNQTGICSGSKCRHNGATCFSNSECKVIGKCKKESTYVSTIKELVSVNICKY